MNKKEINTIISLINMFQFDGAQWTIDNINLDDLRERLENETKGQPDS